MDGGFLAVLHTWGRALNWHPHLHVLSGAGGKDRATGRWRQARAGYLFPVKAMSKVFGAIMLRRIEALEGSREVNWPAGLESLEARRDWRLRLAGRNWNIFSRPTLGNTRAVVRYLARYTSRIAMSNQRLTRVDEEQRTVSFHFKDYRDGGRTKELTMAGADFLRCFTRHLVPKGFRRVRYYGLLAGRKGRIRELPGAPRRSIGERSTTPPRPVCPRCGDRRWRYLAFYRPRAMAAAAGSRRIDASPCESGENRFSLGSPAARPRGRPTSG
jgi:hypothetical protein